MPRSKAQRRKEAEARLASATARDCGHRHTDNGAKFCKGKLQGKASS